MPDLVKRLSAAADRRRAMDPAALARLDATLTVLQQDHQSIDGSGSTIGIETDTLAPVGEVFGLDSLDLHLLLVAAAPDVDANVGLVYGLLRGATGPARPTVGLALELAGVSTMSPLAVARLGASGGLRCSGLVQCGADGSWLARELWCPDRVVSHLQGWDVPDPELAAALLDPTPLPLAGSEQRAVRTVARRGRRTGLDPRTARHRRAVPGSRRRRRDRGRRADAAGSGAGH